MGNIICTFDIPGICGMGLHMQLDGFRILYSSIATFMWIVSTIFSLEYMSHYKNKGRYYFFLAVTYLATVGVFLSVDFYTTFIFFEIMSLASYVWVAQDEKPASLRAAGTYLAVAIIGGLVMLMGIFLLYDLTGTLKFDELIGLSGQAGLLKALGYPEASTRLWAAAICLLFGFGAKAGAFPLHIWLPKAHPVAPAPASALLSGILTKAGVFGILILTSYIFVGDAYWGAFILVIGVCTMFLGALLALLSIDLKRTLACSSVSQIGFIMTGIGMAGLLAEENAMALRGSLLHMVNHSLIKLVLFSVAGVVFMNLHSLDLNEVRGFGRKKPLLNVLFLMGALGIGGIPLWNGYISKTLIHESIVEYTEIISEGIVEGMFAVGTMKFIEWVFLLSGGFTVAYMTKLYVCLFIEKNIDGSKQQKYDGMKHYMNSATTIVLTASAVILPIMGFLPKIIMEAMADMSAYFLHAGDLHDVAYFSLENLKGAVISIAIGAFLYCVVNRLLLMPKTESTDENGKRIREYANLWPKWMDLENVVYRPVILYALPFVFGVICRVLDSLTDWIVVILRKTIYKDSKIVGELPEGNAISHLVGTIANGFRRLRLNLTAKEDKENVDYVHRAALSYTRFNENIFIIVRSMSFGLLLFCMGLVITVVYMFVKRYLL